MIRRSRRPGSHSGREKRNVEGVRNQASLDFRLRFYRVKRGEKGKGTIGRGGSATLSRETARNLIVEGGHLGNDGIGRETRKTGNTTSMSVPSR